MLDETKVRVMTRLASYEEGAGKKYMPIAKYFRGDYISLQLLRSFISGTVAYIVVFGLIAFCNFESFLSDIYDIDLVEYARGLGKKYIIFMLVYLIATYIWAVIKYTRAKKSVRSYISVMEKFSNKYYE